MFVYVCVRERETDRVCVCVRDSVYVCVCVCVSVHLYVCVCACVCLCMFLSLCEIVRAHLELLQKDHIGNRFIHFLLFNSL